jgi:hypothetical protein
VSRRMFADILSLIARLRHRPSQHDREFGSDATTTMAEVRPDAGKAARFSVSAQSTGSFGYFPAARCAIYRAGNARRGDPGLATILKRGNVGLVQSSLRSSARASASVGITSPTAPADGPWLRRQLRSRSRIRSILHWFALPLRERDQLPMSPGYRLYLVPITRPTQPRQGMRKRSHIPHTPAVPDTSHVATGLMAAGR